MKRGILLHTLLTRLLFTAAAFFMMPLSSVCAQQNNPEIYVDMEVLEQLDPSDQLQQQVPVRLKPPASKPIMQPRLTVPNNPPLAAPSGSYVSKPPSMPVDVIDRGYVSQTETNEGADSIAPAKIPVANSVPFPVKTRVRSETSDPSVNVISRPVPIRSGIAGNLNDNVPSRPAIDFDPEAKPKSVQASPVQDLTEKPAAMPTVVSKPRPLKTEKKPPVVPIRKPDQNVKQAGLPVDIETTDVSEKAVAEKKPPVIPPRRPGNVQKASPELVAELRARELNKKHIPLKAGVEEAEVPLPPPGPMGRKNMPAVAKPGVDSEELPEQAVKSRVNNDPLLDRLVEKDKESLVATIESMVDEREDGKLVPKESKAKRELGTNIVRAQPLQRPYNVYRPKKDGDVAETEPDDTQEKIEATQNIEVASLPEPEPVVIKRPRSKDEQAFISLPFAIGMSEIDESLIREIEKHILPVLNKNPESKLQIHGFASPSQDGASSARKTSLSRAMSIRTYLVGKGIEATRMNIRAVGAESDQEPLDRVDLIVFDPTKKG